MTTKEKPMNHYDCVILEETSKRITSLRYLLIVFVVFIHSNLTPEDALNYYHYDFVQHYWMEEFKKLYL